MLSEHFIQNDIFCYIYIYYKHYYLDTADIIPTLSMYWYDGLLL